MDQTVEQEIAPATIEATLNYIVNNGEKIFRLHQRTRFQRQADQRDTRSAQSNDPQWPSVRGAFRSGA